MSKKANPVAIGSFVIGALALIVIGVMVFSSGKLFSTTYTAVAVFPETVKGLTVGNPVEFRGVRVGSVKDIRMIYDPKTLAVSVPVYLEITAGNISDMNLEKTFEFKSQKEWNAQIARLIETGLRAQLDIQSVVTGQMMVVLDFHPDAPPAEPTQIDARYLEIPTLPSTMSRMMGMLQKIPLDKLAQKVMTLLDDVDDLAQSPELKSMLENADLAAQDARKLLAGLSAQVDPLSASTQATLDEVRQAVGAIEKRLNRTLGDLSGLSKDAQGKLDTLSKPAAAALNEAQAALKSVDDLVGKNSATRADLESTLQELAGAARSLRILADYLEQHPDALIRGKGY